MRHTLLKRPTLVLALPLPLALAPLLLVSSTSSAWAQTLRLPMLPERHETNTTAETNGRKWEYSLGTGVGWDSNLDFLIPDGPSEHAVLPRGGLARVFWSPRSRLSAAAGGGFIGYPEQSQLHRYRSELMLEGDFRRSPVTEWRANASYGVGYSDTSRILLEQGVLLPLLVRTRSGVAGVGVSRKAGRKRMLRADVRYYRTQFDDDDPDDGQRVIDGASVRATLGLDRKLGPRSSAGIEYSVEDVFEDQVGRSYLTHFASLQWTSVLSSRSALLIEGGASYTPDALRAGLEHEANFFGGLSFSRQLRRSSLTLFARREVTPAFGLGVSRVELRGGLSAAVPIGRDWELRVLASHVRPETRQAGEHAYPTAADAFAVLARRLGRRLEISSELRYRRRGRTPLLPLVEAFQASLFLTLQSPNWKSIAPPSAR
jgi:hypothetical protein